LRAKFVGKARHFSNPLGGKIKDEQWGVYVLFVALSLYTKVNNIIWGKRHPPPTLDDSITTRSSTSDKFGVLLSSKSINTLPALLQVVLSRFIHFLDRWWSVKSRSEQVKGLATILIPQGQKRER
jgi:hypothetical protein